MQHRDVGGIKLLNYILSDGDICYMQHGFTQWAFVNVLIAGSSKVSCRAGTEVISANWAGVTVGAFLTRIADAGVIQLAQQS